MESLCRPVDVGSDVAVAIDVLLPTQSFVCPGSRQSRATSFLVDALQANSVPNGDTGYPQALRRPRCRSAFQSADPFNADVLSTKWLGQAEIHGTAAARRRCQEEFLAANASHSRHGVAHSAPAVASVSRPQAIGKPSRGLVSFARGFGGVTQEETARSAQVRASIASENAHMASADAEEAVEEADAADQMEIFIIGIQVVGATGMLLCAIRYYLLYQRWLQLRKYQKRANDTAEKGCGPLQLTGA